MAEEVPPGDPPVKQVVDEAADEPADAAPRTYLGVAIDFARALYKNCVPKRAILTPFEQGVKASRLLRRTRKDFARFDADGSGGIDRDELCDILGIDRRGTTSRAVLDFFDADGDGKINFEEFVSTLGTLGVVVDNMRRCKENRKDNISREVCFVFAVMDFDGDGRVDRGDFAQLLWEYERRKERSFGRLKSVPVANFSAIDSSLEVTATERYIADQRAERRELLRPVRAFVKSATLYLSRQCPEAMTLQDVDKVYTEFKPLFEATIALHKQLRNISERCAKLIRTLYNGIDDIEELHRQMCDRAIAMRAKREENKGDWDWAKGLQRTSKHTSAREEHVKEERQVLAEVAQIGRLLRGERVVKSGTEEEREFLGAFSFRRDGSVHRAESRRLRGPRASGRGSSSIETARMRARQLAHQPPREAAKVLSELGVTAQKDVIHRLSRDNAAKIIVEMGQLQQDVLLCHFKELQESVMRIKIARVEDFGR